MRVTALHRFVRPLGPLLTVLALSAGLALVSGCPRQPDAPEPLSGTPCTQVSECNDSRTANPTCARTACEPAWRECVDTCDRVEACETACQVELSACARGCF